MINRKRASATLYSLMLSMAPSATGQVLPFFTRHGSNRGVTARIVE